MKLYRVFPYDASAVPTDRGGALFVPPATGVARIDNPELYAVLYTAASPVAAVAEAFGRIPIWRREAFVHGTGSSYALGVYELPDTSQIYDVNDVDALRAIGVSRPTDIITRDRVVTQMWTRRIYELHRYAGIAWWSYYKPECQVIGLWDVAGLRPAEPPTVLGLTNAIVRDAAEAIVRQVDR